MSNVPNILLAFSSAALLIAAFPPCNQLWAAWIALVPWLQLLARLKSRAAFGWSWLIGFLFFLGSLWWLTNLRAFAGVMAFVAWLALCAYLALFFGGFGALTRHILTRHPASGIQWLVVPAIWVALEYLRTHFLSGFGWNLLGYSQTPWPLVIQFADLTGAWGVSFLLVLVNTLLFAALRAQSGPRWAYGTAAVAAIILCGTYGMQAFSGMGQRRSLRVTVLQGNVPQQEKWDEMYKDDILRRYEGLTAAAAEDHPQLIIWPETSAPGYLALDEPLTQRLVELAKRVRTPLLVGAPMAHLEGGVWKSTNSAALISAEGRIVDQYDKLRLVPFGEYVPFERPLPWLRHALPPIGEFVPGRRLTVFHPPLPTRPTPKAKGWHEQQIPQPQPFGLATLICFEDIFPDLARRFVQAGAQVLVVITNDAWFGPSAAAYQHAQASIMRAVELRVPVIRAANTGWSGCIDPSGRVTGRIEHRSGSELFVEGRVTCDVSLKTSETLYRRWGDWFAWVCAAIVLLAMPTRLRARS